MAGLLVWCVQSYFPFFTIFDLWQDEDRGGGFSFGSLYCKLAPPQEAARLESGRMNAKTFVGPSHGSLIFNDPWLGGHKFLFQELPRIYLPQ